MKNRKYYISICLYGLLLIILFLGFNHIYGSNVDWISQHSVIPEYFRDIFYETGKLIPNFVFNLGAGQNIYNYSYYGLLSPIILVSYILPFIKMVDYIQLASVFLYIMFGILMFTFIDSNLKNKKIAFLCSLMVMTISSINFNFHHHIMFVWYLPFLLVAFFGIDKYLHDGKSWLLMVGTFLLILTNYYYSVTSLVVIYLYGIYKILKGEKITFKEIVRKGFYLVIRLIIPILMGMIILLPTLGALKGMTRSSLHNINVIQLLFPNLKELFYSPHGVGLVGVMFLALIFNLTREDNKVEDIFLNGSLLLVVLVPIFMFIFNGFLYVRGKVLIPFLPLIILCFGYFYSNLLSNKIKFRLMKKILIIFVIISLFKLSNIVFIIEIFISLYFVNTSIRKKNIKILGYYALFTLFVGSFLCNFYEKYIESDYYKKNDPSLVEKLYDDIEDKDFYRSYNKLNPKNDPNKVYGSNYYSPTIYSSTYNSKYWDFYNFKFGNNISYRNSFITAGTDNELFYTYMGVKYITAKDAPGFYYDKIDRNKSINLYYNKYAYPICYVPNNIGSVNKLKELDFPYNLEYMMKNGIVNKNNGNNKTFDTIISEYKDERVDDNYKFNLKNSYFKRIDLPNYLSGKILYVSFEMKKDQKCFRGDTYIIINGIKNKLTCKDGIYHNKNYNFEYVIPITDEQPYLDIEIGKGKYNISNVRMYYSDIIKENNTSINNLVVDKGRSVITGNINLDKDNYLVSSIPFDEGFRAFVNGKEVNCEVVNTAFLGFKLKKGRNNIKIVYKSPYFDIGLGVSLVGISLFMIVCIYEILIKKKDNV